MFIMFLLKQQVLKFSIFFREFGDFMKVPYFFTFFLQLSVNDEISWQEG